MPSCFKVSIFICILAVLCNFVWKYRDQREYNFRTTAEEAANNVNLKDKVIIVTGANTGIGKVTAQTLLNHGATVILACRNKQKAENAKKDILNNISPKLRSKASQNIDIILLDLGSLSSIDLFVVNFLNKYSVLNYLILNAGVISYTFKTTKDGIESHFGINHIGHYYLTKQLTKLLIKSAKGYRIISRVVAVSSWAHNAAPSNINDWLLNDTLIQNENIFDSLKNYGFSKICNILFAKEYNDKYKNKNVFAVSLHPGSIPTDLIRDNPKVIQFLWTNVFGSTFLKTVEQGAATTIRTISLNDTEFIKHGGGYFSDSNPAPEGVRSDLFPSDVGEYKMPQKLLEKLTNDMIEKYYKK